MLENYGIKTGVVPTCGWMYEQPIQGGFQRIPTSGEFHTDVELVSAVRTFRIQAGIEVGSPEHDVAEFIAQRSPRNCSGRKSVGRTHERMPCIERIKSSLIAMTPMRPKLLPEYEARIRAKNCIGCPQNVKWQTACAPCNEDVVFRGQNLRRVAFFDLDPQLHACRLHDIHLPSAIFIERDFLPPKQNTAPAGCWLKP